MTEGYLHIGVQHSAARLVFKQVTGSKGVGLVRLVINAEVTTKHASAVGCPLMFRGRLETLGVGGPDMALPLAPLRVLDRDPILRDVGVEEHFTLTADIDDRQLQIMEENRSGSQRFRLWLSGITLRDGHYEPFHANNIDYTISQSDWIMILEQVGYTKKFLIEVDAGNLQLQPALVDAYTYYVEARTRYMQGEWRHCVESLRQCLAALVGKKPEDEDSLTGVQAALKTTKAKAFTEDVGYAERFELVRQAAKFLCDFAAHPSEDTRRTHAHASLILVTGILESFRR